MRKLIYLILFLPHFLFSQNFVFPIKPGETAYLAGNMGEVRGSHFHGGLDITANMNTPVQSAAKGYISFIGVSAYGAGKMLKITHPDLERVTVYGHLNGFPDSLTAFIRQKQTELKEAELELELEPNQFPVEAGQVVAFSGNTGYSAGPHLHFEIRTLDNLILNPSTYNFPELPKDDLPPILEGLVLTTLSLDGRVNEEFGSFRFPTQKKGSVYEVKEIIPVWGTVGLELSTLDKANKAHNTYATSVIRVILDGEKVYEHEIMKFSADNHRSMNVHVNYRSPKRKFQRAYVADGNRFQYLYKDLKNNGKITIKDEKVHQVEVQMEDVWGNRSVLKLKLQGKKSDKPIFQGTFNVHTKAKIRHEVWENTLVIAVKNLQHSGDTTWVMIQGIPQALPLAYQTSNEAIYLWDLRKGMPTLFFTGKTQYHFYFRKMIPSQQDTFFQDNFCRIEFDRESLFDTLYLELQYFETAIQLNNTHIPLFKPIHIQYFKNDLIHSDSFGDFYWLGSNLLNGKWENGSYRFNTINLGSFHWLEDKEPPVIEKLNSSEFKVFDKKAGLGYIQAKLGNEFLPTEYEYKNRRLKVYFPKGKNANSEQFTLKVSDRVGNIQEI